MNENNDLMQQNNNNINNLNENTQTIEIPRKRDKKQLILIVVMAFILILGITGRFIIFSINKNSNNAFLLSLGKLKMEMSDIVKPLSFLPTDYGNNYSIDGKMDINVIYNEDNLEEYGIFKEIIDAINKINFNYAVKIDAENKKLLYVFNPTIDNEELFNIKFYNQNKSNYVFLGNLYDKYIQLEDTEFEVTETIDYSLIKEEINQIYNVVVKSLKENLKEEYFIKENTNINLGTESKEVLKSTLVLDEKNVSEITINIIKSLKENKETKKIITKYVPEFFDEELEVVGNTEDGPVLYFSTYMNKITGKQYQYKIESKSEYEDFSATYILGKEKELIISNNYKYYGDNIITYKLLIDTNKDKTNIEMKDTNSEVIMTLELTKEKIVYSQNTKMDDQNAEVNITYEFKERKNKEEYEIIISGLLELTENNEELLTININSDNLLKKKVNIDETLADIIKFDEMTEEDFDQIISELYNIYAKVIE